MQIGMEWGHRRGGGGLVANRSIALQEATFIQPHPFFIGSNYFPCLEMLHFAEWNKLGLCNDVIFWVCVEHCERSQAAQTGSQLASLISAHVVVTPPHYLLSFVYNG